MKARLSTAAHNLRSIHTTDPHPGPVTAWEDARHAHRENVRASEPSALLLDAEERAALLLRRPLSASVARAIALVVATQARGRRVPLRAFWQASRETVEITLRGLATEIGRGSEERRRQTLRELCDWAEYAAELSCW